MTAFQALALPLLAVLCLRKLYRLARGDRPRAGPLLGTAIWGAAALAVLRPEWTTGLAGLLGIGRGADLISYLVAILFVLSTLYFYQRVHALQAELTEVVRGIALREGLEHWPATAATLAPEPRRDPSPD
jgi:hypothetical protein